MSASLSRLRISANHHFLVTDDGRPFFWMGDTAWNLFHRTTRPEAEEYFAARQRQGFNIIQAVALAEQDGLNSPSANGQRPLFENDPTRPNGAYFAYVDELVDLAAGYGLYVCLLPTWADKVTPHWGAGPVIFDPHRAYLWGKWIGAHYADRPNIVWCLGGDRPMFRGSTDWGSIWRQMAAGVREATRGEALITYHPDGGLGAPSCVHAEGWSDCVMIQSGHWARENPTWEWVESLYRLQPPKPVLDGEPNYEDHPVAPWPEWDPASGYFRDYEVRKQVYRSVFAGGCGVTYGHHSVWQFYGPRYEPINHPDRTWSEALYRPGAEQMAHLKNLMLSRPYFSRVPDQTLLLSDFEDDEAGFVSIEPSGAEHIRATRSASHEGQYAFVYFPNASQTAWVDLEKFAAPPGKDRFLVRAWWYDPRTGSSVSLGEYPRQPEAFTSPSIGPDWVLVLDDAQVGFAPPGEAG